MVEKFNPQFAYALGNPDHPDSPWKAWPDLREEDAPAVLRGIRDAVHRREVAEFLEGYRPYLARGLTVGEAVEEVERQRAAEGGS